MLVAFIIMGLAVNGYTKLSVKGLKYAFIVISLIGAFYIYLFSVDIERLFYQKSRSFGRVLEKL